MIKLQKRVWAVLLATIWIAGSEFLRNEILLKSFWTEHYARLGLVFPSGPVNGAMWGVWSLLFAVAVYILAKRFTLVQTAAVAWLVGFVLMWVVIGNLGVLPYGLLMYAVPLSMLEAFLAAAIIKKLT